MKSFDNYSNMDNDGILENNLLLEKVQLQQKYLTSLVTDLGKEINMLVSVSRAFLSIMKHSNLTDDKEFEALVNQHHKSIEKILDSEDKRYQKIIAELREVNEQIEMIHGGTFGES
tara:strand:+ start:238 stop:585 length:348 start_codon:yes stop_codon:yes gene_type:complete